MYWRRLSRHNRVGRPGTRKEIRELIRKIASANPFWGSPRVHGELLKLGISISERTLARLMPKRKKPPSQTWRAFLDNHLLDLVSIDFLAVPTATFRVLFVLIVLAHHRRRAVHFNVTEHPTALWTAEPIIQAFPDGTEPGCLLLFLSRKSPITLQFFAHQKRPPLRTKSLACWQDCVSCAADDSRIPAPSDRKQSHFRCDGF